jgi:hypothetical protein
MAIQLSTRVRNAVLDVMETTIGDGPTMTIRSGAAPADCATANSGTVLVTIVMPTDSPSDWMAPASGGTKAFIGSWIDTSADAGGTAAHFRVHSTDGTCDMQGTVTATGGGGDLTLNTVTITAAQQVEITGFTWTAGGA